MAEDPAQALKLAEEATSRGDAEATVAHLSAAVRGYTAADEPRHAAMACIRLGDTFGYSIGNLTAARAWFARARRLVKDEEPCVEQGWVAVAAMGCDVDDPGELLAAAELALERSRTFGDVNLETKALADAGLAHVQAGRVGEGMAMLDEAMALACGPADDADTAAKSVCSFFTACYFSADFERAGSWANLLRKQGLISRAPGGPVFLSSHCESVQATLLIELGRWGDAEAVLTRAKAEFEDVMQTTSWHADIALADLRVRQGRYADAEALLLGKDHAMQALLPAARLHLARGDHELARATARRGLRLVGDDVLRAIELLTVLVDAELAQDKLEGARQACSDLAKRTTDVPVSVLRSRAEAVCARVQAAAGDLTGAMAALEASVDRLDVTQHPWLCATLLLDLARLRERAGDKAGATVDAGAAAGVLETLDVQLSSEDVALLDRLEGTQATGSQAAGVAELRRDGSWWVASWQGTNVRLKSTKGLCYLAELVAHPGTERHALDLVDRVEGVSPEGLDRRRLGDAGDILDASARAAYRRRIEELRGEVDEALAIGQLEAAEAKQEEIDALVRQLAHAFGLGGRHRRAASAAERARLNVTRALRAALARLADALPGAGAALDRGVRTGMYCVYTPSDGDVRWIVQS